MTGKSVNAVAAEALGISATLIPNKLRNRLNGYIRNKAIPESMIETASNTSQSREYEKKPIKDGSQTYLRNIVILDTLFDDPKIVKKLVLNTLKKKDREKSLFNLQYINAAKLNLLQSMGPMMSEIQDFLTRDDIDWKKEVIPYPYEDGAYSSPLIAANLLQDANPSIYDQALSHYYYKDYTAALQVVNNYPEEFMGPETSLLRIILEEKQATHQEYADYLATFN